MKINKAKKEYKEFKENEKKNNSVDLTNLNIGTIETQNATEKPKPIVAAANIGFNNTPQGIIPIRVRHNLFLHDNKSRIANVESGICATLIYHNEFNKEKIYFIGEGSFITVDPQDKLIDATYHTGPKTKDSTTEFLKRNKILNLNTVYTKMDTIINDNTVVFPENWVTTNKDLLIIKSIFNTINSMYHLKDLYTYNTIHMYKSYQLSFKIKELRYTFVQGINSTKLSVYKDTQVKYSTECTINKLQEILSKAIFTNQDLIPLESIFIDRLCNMIVNNFYNYLKPEDNWSYLDETSKSIVIGTISNKPITIDSISSEIVVTKPQLIQEDVHKKDLNDVLISAITELQ